MTLNPHTQSPSLSPRLISSSSSSSTNSSTSTVLLKSNVNTPPPPPPIESKTSSLVQAKTSQLPKRTAIKNVSRLKAPSTAPTKIPSSTSQVKTPSLIGTKSIKPMLTNNTATTLRKPIAITNQSSTMTNSSIVNKTTPQQVRETTQMNTYTLRCKYESRQYLKQTNDSPIRSFLSLFLFAFRIQSSSTLTTAKKLHFINGGTNMTEPSSSNNPGRFLSVSLHCNRFCSRLVVGECGEESSSIDG